MNVFADTNIYFPKSDHNCSRFFDDEIYANEKQKVDESSSILMLNYMLRKFMNKFPLNLASSILADIYFVGAYTYQFFILKSINS